MAQGGRGEKKTETKREKVKSTEQGEKTVEMKMTRCAQRELKENMRKVNE